MAVSIGTHWRVLAAVCAIMWGIYFIYDLPAPLSVPLQEHLSLSDTQYTYLVSALYTAYAAPNTVLPLFSGLAVERLGEKRVLLVTLMSVVTGQLIFALATQFRALFGMMLGRVLIGLGAEIIGVLGSEITTRWFKDKQLSLTLAILLCISKLGSVAASVFVPRMIVAFGVVWTVWVASIFSLGVAVISSLYLLAADPSIALHHRSESLHSVYSLRQFPRAFWHLALICILGYGGINTFTMSAQRFLAAWFYNGDQRKAGTVVGIPYFLSGILTLPFGLLLNMPWFQSYPACLGATNILMIKAHLLLLYRIEPIGAMCLLGISYALYSVAFWAGLARCLLSIVESAKTDVSENEGRSSVDGYEYGTISVPTQFPDNHSDGHSDGSDRNNEWERSAEDSIITHGYGIMTSLNNLSTGAVPVFLAMAENACGFRGLELFFLTLSLLGLFASGGLLWS